VNIVVRISSTDKSWGRLVAWTHTWRASCLTAFCLIASPWCVKIHQVPKT